MTVRMIIVKLGLTLRALYDNHQLRKIQYRHLMESKQSADTLKDRFFKAALLKDREVMGRRMKRRDHKAAIEAAGDVLSREFDQALARLIKTDLGYKTDAKLTGDYSYNICYVPRFRQVFYNDYIRPLFDKVLET